MKPTQALHDAGQSLWLDNITRTMLDEGTLAEYVDELSVTGLTSNPTIFEKAIGSGDAYDTQIQELLASGADVGDGDVFFDARDRRPAPCRRRVRPGARALGAPRRLRLARGLSRAGVRHRGDGRAGRRAAPPGRARRTSTSRSPGRPEGLPAIEETIYAGIPVNVTLLFVSASTTWPPPTPTCAASSGAIADGLPPDVPSVASLFMSRWDKAVAETARRRSCSQPARAGDRRPRLPRVRRAARLAARAAADERWSARRSGCCGRAPARRTRAPRTPSTSTGSPRRSPSTRCPTRRCMAYADHGAARAARWRRTAATPRTSSPTSRRPASTSTRSPRSSSERAPSRSWPRGRRCWRRSSPSAAPWPAPRERRARARRAAGVRGAARARGGRARAHARRPVRRRPRARHGAARRGRRRLPRLRQAARHGARRSSCSCASPQEAGLPQRIDAMFAGEHINVSEDRAVLHVALRAPRGARIEADGEDVVPQVHEVLDRMGAFSERVRSGAWTGATGRPIRNVVNIGIGGSHLGPEMATLALASYARRDMRFRFVSNVDGSDFAEKTHDLDPAETLFVIVSKTFTTLETLTNAGTARDWLVAVARRGRRRPALRGGLDERRARRARSGSTLQNMFGFWDWVGGRYSMDSAVGLSIDARDRAGGLRRAARRLSRDGRAPAQCAARREPAGAARPAQRLEHDAAGPRNRRGPAVRRRALRALRPTCSSWRWRATAST